MPTLIKTLTDWEAMAVRDASILTGTPEQPAKLMEARRYRHIRTELEAMAEGRDSLSVLIDQRDQLAHWLRALIEDVTDPTHVKGDWSEQVVLRNARDTLEAIYPQHRLKDHTE